MSKTVNPFNGLEKKTQELVFALDGMRSKLNTHEDYNTQLRMQLLRKIREDAYKHSVNMEIEHNQFFARHKLEDERRNFEHQLTEAWEYLSENPLTIGTLSDLGAMVDPKGNEGTVGFRKTEVAIGSVSPPPPEQILGRIDSLVRDLNEFEGYDLFRSAHAHLEIALIHPWKDGNGKYARLIGDYTLQQRGLGAAVLLDTEKAEYTRVLREALKDQVNFKNLIYEPTPALYRFADFIGQRSLASMKKIEKVLENNKIYYINPVYKR